MSEYEPKVYYHPLGVNIWNDPLVGKEPTYQCWRHKRLRFHPWVRKIPWRRAWQPTPVFLPGESPWTKKPGGL